MAIHIDNDSLNRHVVALGFLQGALALRLTSSLSLCQECSNLGSQEFQVYVLPYNACVGLVSTFKI